MNNLLEAKKDRIVDFCRRHNIRRLSLFGSQLKGPADRTRDIDLLVEFESGREPGLMGLVDMEHELSAMLGGQVVDLRTPDDLSRYFREEVIRSSQVQYAR